MRWTPLPAAEEIRCDASRAASSSQVLQDLSGHVGQQRRHHQQTIRGHRSAQGNIIPRTHFHNEISSEAIGT